MNYKIDGDNMNKKGFSVIELIATIVIISIVSLVATVTVSFFIKKATDQTYKNIEETMKTAAQNYMLKGNDFDTITAENLIKNGFMETPIDPKTKNSCYTKKSYVKANKSKINQTTNDKYEYNVCLICGDYISDYCEEKDKINLEYRMIEEDDYIILDDSININKFSNAQIKYFTNHDIKTELLYEFTDDTCNEYFLLSPAFNDSFRIVLLKAPENKVCEVKVYDKDKDTNLKARTFKINVINDTEDKQTKDIIMYEDFSTQEDEIGYNINFETANQYVRRYFKVVNNDGEFLEDDTKNLKFELINNKNSNQGYCLNSYNNNQEFNGYDSIDNNIYQNKWIELSYLTDGCDNVKLKVTSGDLTRYFGVSLKKMSHIENVKVSKKYIELQGSYSPEVASSYFTQEIKYTPANAQLKEFTCESSNEKKAICKIVGNKITVKGNGEPTSSGEYVYLTIKPTDTMTKANTITLKVKVNNVVPESYEISVDSSASYQCARYNNYICLGATNYAKPINVYPKNAIYTNFRGSTEGIKEEFTSFFDNSGKISLRTTSDIKIPLLATIKMKLFNTYEKDFSLTKEQSIRVVPKGYSYQTQELKKNTLGKYELVKITHRCCA